jgi:hypothetical protein
LDRNANYYPFIFAVPPLVASVVSIRIRNVIADATRNHKLIVEKGSTLGGNMSMQYWLQFEGEGLLRRRPPDCKTNRIPTINNDSEIVPNSKTLLKAFSFQRMSYWQIYTCS